MCVCISILIIIHGFHEIFSLSFTHEHIFSLLLNFLSDSSSINHTLTGFQKDGGRLMFSILQIIEINKKEENVSFVDTANSMSLTSQP